MQLIFRSLSFNVLLLLTATFTQSLAAEEPVEPLLQKYCLGCHNRQNAEMGLSLQTFDAIKSGSDSGPVLNKLNPEDSLLYHVLSPDVDNTMPPSGEPQPTASERQRLKQWVRSGSSIQSMAAGIPNVPLVKPHGKRTAQSFSSVAISNSEFAVGGSRQIAIHHSVTGSKLRQFKVPEGNITSLDWAEQSQLLLAAVGLPGINGAAVLLSAKDGRITQRFEGHTDSVYCAVIDNDETLVATAGYDRRILIHDVVTGNVIKTLSGHHGSIFQLCFNATGNVLCSASTDGTVKVWNVRSGERLDTLSQAQGEQYCVQVGNKLHQVFAAGEDNRIRIWDLVADEKPTINPLRTSVFAHEKTIHRMQLSDDESQLATAAEDGTVRIWTTQPLRQRQTLPIQESMVTSLMFAKNDRLIVTTLKGGPTAFAIVTSPEPKQAIAAQTDTAKVDAMVNGSEPTAQTGSESKSSPVLVSESKNDNDAASSAQHISVPAVVSGHIYNPDSTLDRDCFVFEATAGQALVLEVNAARSKSPLDSKIEILTETGTPLLRTQLQAVRDSWFTFRGKDSNQSGDFRLFNWREMELNQFLYADGEVTKLHHYPRGPDSGFNVYPGFGKRHTYFGTTGTSHALLAPAFIVEPYSPEAELVSNGLPIFPVYYENDDDGLRELGADSRLFFDVPKTGRYVVRISDAREFSGEDYHYQLTVRETQPSFSITHNATKFSVSKGVGKEIEFKAKRIDGYKGPITIEATSVPPGYVCSTPVTIQRDQYRAYATLFATSTATEVTDLQREAIRFTATADKTASGQHQVDIQGPAEFELREEPKLKVAIHPSKADASSSKQDDGPATVVLSIRPGQTINAFLTLDRLEHKGVVSFGKEDAGRNLPYGVFVDNIGLNGLLLLKGQTEREFYITASPVAEPGTYPFHLKSNVDGITSYPATLVVEPPPVDVVRQQ